MDWAVLTSTSGRELAARDALRALGVDAYCPVVRRLTKPRRKSKPVEVVTAAFPRYLFADPTFTDHDRHPALTAVSLARLSLGGVPCVVSDAEVDRLRAEDDVRAAEAVDATRFVAGDHVRVTWGPLAGVEGVVTAALRDGYELEVPGSGARVQTPGFSMERAEGRPLR